MFWRFLFSKISSSAQDHAVLVLLLSLVGLFISARPRWSGGNILYHSCTSFEGASRWGEPFNIFTWFIGSGGYIHRRITHRISVIYTYSKQDCIEWLIIHTYIHIRIDCVYIYIYIHIRIDCVCIYIYIHIRIARYCGECHTMTHMIMCYV